MAYAKAELAAGEVLPIAGTVFLSTHDRDKQALGAIAIDLASQGFALVATAGTAKHLRAEGLEVTTVLKVHEGRPNVEDAIRSGEIQLIINTPIGRQATHDDRYLRRAALDYQVPTVTTLAGARAAVAAVAEAVLVGVSSKRRWVNSSWEASKPAWSNVPWANSC
jgi:carbamoyl-phosphate synthase large subunit